MNRTAASSLPQTNTAIAVSRILGFIVLFGGTAFLLNWAIDSGLRKIPTSKFGAFNTVMSGKADSELVINGSSRALSHYDPSVFQSITGHSTFNIGMNASQIDFQLAMLKIYLRHNVKPLAVIQNLDSFSFETTLPGDIYDPGLYLPYLDDPILYDSLRHIDPVVWKWRHIPLYGFAVDDMRFTWLAGLLAECGIYGREDYYRGFNPRSASWNDDFQKFHKEHPSGISYKIEPDGIGALIELVQTCKSAHIQLILVYSPEFAEMQSLETNRPLIFAQFKDIAARYDIPFIDYSGSEISRRQELFQNSQHLNAKGAAIFSADLAHKLVDSHVISAAESR